MIVNGKPGIGLTAVALIMCSELSVIPLFLRILLNISMCATYYLYIVKDTWRWIDPRFEVINVPKLNLLRNQWASTDLTCPNVGKPQYVINPNYTQTNVLQSPVLFAANRAMYLGLIAVLVGIPALSREILSVSSKISINLERHMVLTLASFSHGISHFFPAEGAPI